MCSDKDNNVENPIVASNVSNEGSEAVTLCMYYILFEAIFFLLFRYF